MTFKFKHHVIMFLNLNSLRSRNTTESNFLDRKPKNNSTHLQKLQLLAIEIYDVYDVDYGCHQSYRFGKEVSLSLPFLIVMYLMDLLDGWKGIRDWILLEKFLPIRQSIRFEGTMEGNSVWQRRQRFQRFHIEKYNITEFVVKSFILKVQGS